MYRRNPTITCPDCGTGNPSKNWQCWKCKKEGRVTELEEVGGASSPWASNKTVYGGKLYGEVGSSSYWRRRNLIDTTSLIDPQLGLDVAHDIFQRNPDSEESDTGVNDMDLNHEDELPEEIEEELIEDVEEEEEEEEDLDTEVAEVSSNSVSPRYRRRNSDPVWGGPLYRRNPECPECVCDPCVCPECPECVCDPCVCPETTASRSERRIRDTGPKQKRLTPEEFAKALGAKIVGPSPRTRSTQSILPPKKESYSRNRLRRRNSDPVWGDPLYRNRRRNSDPVWGGPLYRRNPCEDCNCSPCSCRRRNSAPVWGGPLYRRRNSDPVWGGPLYRNRRRNSDPVWGGPLYRGRRRNSDPAWGGPLYRRNPCVDCDCDPCTCGTSCRYRRRNPRRRRNSDPVWGGPLYRRRRRRRRNPRRRRNSDPVWGGPLYRRQLRRNPRFSRRRNSDPAWGGPLYRRNS